MLEEFIFVMSAKPPENLPLAVTISSPARMLSAFILPVAEILVVDILDTVIRPVIDAFDADRLETNVDVELRVGMVANTAVNSVVTERYATEVLPDVTVPIDNVVTERLLTEKLHTLPDETNKEEAE